ATQWLVLLLVVANAGWLMRRTWSQIHVWRDDVTLWQAVIWHYPQSQEEYRFVAQGLVLQARFDEAVSYARHSDAVLTDPKSREFLGLVYRDIAVGFVEQRRIDKALAPAQRAVVLAPTEPTVHAALGLVQLKLGRFSQAIPELELALKMAPALAA